MVATASSPAARVVGGDGEGDGEGGVGQAVEGGVEQEADLGRAPGLHRHGPVEGVEQAGDDEGHARRWRARPTRRSWPGGRWPGRPGSAATVTALGDTPALARGRAMAAIVRSQPPTKPVGGWVRCSSAQSRRCSSPSMGRLNRAIARREGVSARELVVGWGGGRASPLSPAWRDWPAWAWPRPGSSNLTPRRRPSTCGW